MCASIALHFDFVVHFLSMLTFQYTNNCCLYLESSRANEDDDEGGDEEPLMGYPNEDFAASPTPESSDIKAGKRRDAKHGGRIKKTRRYDRNFERPSDRGGAMRGGRGHSRGGARGGGRGGRGRGGRRGK